MATTITKSETLVGKRIRRREDPRLITGTATYVDDIQMPGMHHAVIVRSPHGAAASSPSILNRAGAARSRRGLHREGHGEVCAGSVRCFSPWLARSASSSILAIDRVYFVGHPVAVVVATDRYIARDAADLVEVEYEPLPAVTDPEKAIAAGAPAVHPEWPDNTAFNSTRKAAKWTRHSPKRKWW